MRRLTRPGTRMFVGSVWLCTKTTPCTWRLEEMVGFKISTTLGFTAPITHIYSRLVDPIKQFGHPRPRCVFFGGLQT
jgi:hypothetical protein